MRRSVHYDDLPEFLSPDEFRQYFKLSRNTTYELLRRGEIPHLRFGRQIRIPKTALQQMTLAGYSARPGGKRL
jgi:excisionase family DNA binding protein